MTRVREIILFGKRTVQMTAEQADALSLLFETVHEAESARMQIEEMARQQTLEMTIKAPPLKEETFADFFAQEKLRDDGRYRRQMHPKAPKKKRGRA